METRLSGQSVLVTGASGGIGAATARAFAADGAFVWLHYHTNRDAADELAAELGHAEPVGADLRDEAATDAMFAELTRDRQLDAIVVNAGIWIEQFTPVCDMSLEHWQTTMDADLKSAFLTCRGFLRHLKAQPRDTASIVLISSTAGLFGEEGHADYSAAKAAIAHGLTASLKNEIVRLAPRGRVNCVCPGWILTPMAEKALEGDTIRQVTRTIAMNKVGKPEDVARTIVWLSSPHAADHVSGVVLPVDGGMEGRVLH